MTSLFCFIQIHTIIISFTQLGADLTYYLWQILASFTCLNHLEIRFSSLPVPPRSPSLPSVKTLEANHLTAESYRGLMGSLSGVSEISVGLMYADSELSELVRGFQRAGRSVTEITLKCEHVDCQVSNDTIAKLCDVLRRSPGRLEIVMLSKLIFDVENLVSLVEACRTIRTMKKIM